VAQIGFPPVALFGDGNAASPFLLVNLAGRYGAAACCCVGMRYMRHTYVRLAGAAALGDLTSFAGDAAATHGVNKEARFTALRLAFLALPRLRRRCRATCLLSTAGGLRFVFLLLLLPQ